MPSTYHYGDSAIQDVQKAFRENAIKYPFEFLRAIIYFSIQKIEGEHAESNEQSVLIRQAMQVIDVSYTGNRIEAVKHLIAILKDPESDLYQALNVSERLTTP